MIKIFLKIQIISLKKNGLPIYLDLNYLFNNIIFFIKKFFLTIRIVDKKEILLLNYIYCGLSKTTNILSFIFNFIYGDLIICRQIIEIESFFYLINLKKYWYLIILHGFLHLLGYNHYIKKNSIEMESLEKILLNKFNF